MKIIVSILFFAIFITVNSYSVADNYVITVYCNKDIQVVNKSIFGNNMIAYAPNTYEKWGKDYYGYSDYGAGIWDPTLKKSVGETVALAKEAGIKMLRFPGGCGSHYYNWKEAVGGDRQHFLYGVDEFFKTCEEIGAEAVITVSYFTGNEQDAADLVEYLNSPADGANPNGGVDWALKRLENGHPKPYNIKYFEIGNEEWHGDHRNIKKVLPKEYANRYLKYYKAMKKMDPFIKVGAILDTPDWNRKVMEGIRENIDFGILHIYPTPIWGERLSQMSPRDIFSITLSLPLLRERKEIERAVSLLKKYTGRKVPVAITEYNCGFVQEKPVPYRYTLGCALVNAELLKTFMEFGDDILMANYWQFCNSYWGMIANGFEDKYEDLAGSYYKRPNYYVFELYNKHFGGILLDVNVKCPSYFVRKEGMMPYLSVNASKDRDNAKTYLMVINKNMDHAITATINLKDFKPTKEVDAWILNGSSIDVTNEENHENVRVRHVKLEIGKQYGSITNSFQFTFEPHSLTAIELTRGS